MTVKTTVEYSEEDDVKKRRRLIKNVILLAVSVTMIGAVTVAVETGLLSKADNGEGSIRLLQAVCKDTDFPDQCYQKLEYVGVRAPPTKYVKAGLDKTLEELRPALNFENKNLDSLSPDQMNVLGDCAQLISSAINVLQDMIQWMESDKKFLESNPEDLRIGLSAVISSTLTSLDELELANSTSIFDNGNSIRTPMQTARITLAIVSQNSENIDAKTYPHERPSNRRSLITNYSTIGDSENFNAFPEWMTAADRKLLEAQENGNLKPDVVVAKDGSGQYTSISEAMDNYPLERNTRYVIYVRQGIYSERVFIDSSVTQILMYGDGANNTILAGYFNETSTMTAFMGSTLVVFGHGFLCKDMTIAAVDGTFEYEYEPPVRIHADKSAFFNCIIRGERGSLLAGSHRQFYRDCEIIGGGPVLKGDGAVVIQKSQILLNPTKTTNIISEQLRSDKNENTGFVIHNCSIGINSDYDQNPISKKTYKNLLYSSCLGIPGKEFSRTVIMESFLPAFINPHGWCLSRGDYGLQSATFLEYNNKGVGAETDKRVSWSSFGIITDVEEARRYTPARFLQADSWLKSSGIPYYPGLVSDGSSG